MLSDEEHHAAAKSLMRAEQNRVAMKQLSHTYPHMTLDDAYRVQDLWMQARVAQGARVVGHKIGLTSRAMQMASKMTEPDYGRILDDAFFHDGAALPAVRFIKPRLEVELAFIMSQDLSGPGTPDLRCAAGDGICGARAGDYRLPDRGAARDRRYDRRQRRLRCDCSGRPADPADGCGYTLDRRDAWQRTG